MSTKRTESLEIKDGPSLNLLIDAFKYAYDPVVKIPIKFSIAMVYPYNLPLPHKPGDKEIPLEMVSVEQIVSLEHESGNSYSYNLRGNRTIEIGTEYFKHDYIDGTMFERTVKTPTGRVSARFEAFFDVRTRKGSITFTY